MIWPETNANLLVSYAMIREVKGLMDWIDCAAASGVPVLIDSGAFSNLWLHINSLKTGESSKAWMKTLVTVGEYIEACQEHFHGKVWQYITLDSPRQIEVTRANYNEMRDAGLTPMPVWLEQAPIEDGLAYLEDKQDGYICVAGGVYGGSAYMTERFKTMWVASGQRAKIHALGYTRSPGALYQPIVTCDSHTWLTGQRFGIMLEYSRSKGMLYNVLPWHFLRGRSRMTKGETSRLIETLIEVYNVPWEILKLRKWNGTQSVSSLLTINAFLNFSQHLREKGKHLFLVTGLQYCLFALAGVIATRHGTTFDYQEAFRLASEFRELAKMHPTKGMEAVMSILRGTQSANSS